MAYHCHEFAMDNEQIKKEFEEFHNSFKKEFNSMKEKFDEAQMQFDKMQKDFLNASLKDKNNYCNISDDAFGKPDDSKNQSGECLFKTLNKEHNKNIFNNVASNNTYMLPPRQLEKAKEILMEYMLADSENLHFHFNKKDMKEEDRMECNLMRLELRLKPILARMNEIKRLAEMALDPQTGRFSKEDVRDLLEVADKYPQLLFPKKGKS